VHPPCRVNQDEIVSSRFGGLHAVKGDGGGIGAHLVGDDGDAVILS
jgi:hypothetical protein